MPNLTVAQRAAFEMSPQSLVGTFWIWPNGRIMRVAHVGAVLVTLVRQRDFEATDFVIAFGDLLLEYPYCEYLATGPELSRYRRFAWVVNRDSNPSFTRFFLRLDICNEDGFSGTGFSVSASGLVSYYSESCGSFRSFLRTYRLATEGETRYAEANYQGDPDPPFEPDHVVRSLTVAEALSAFLGGSAPTVSAVPIRKNHFSSVWDRLLQEPE